ncbi:calsyntenin-1 isoform X2 [Neocloeon triangulifer]|uniref:calsyntenin-1 isoform X2 n=1 Tax=Neocloeon triangulifer TaxID=2078957 RepID=UPI00286F51CD|nr:calsyntenin-1 isoform X2 [Neocloeon triangulifer]
MSCSAQVVLLVWCSVVASLATSPPAAVPRLDLLSLESGYHGIVKENETLVEVTPRIRGVGAPICNFRIVNKHHGEAPFEIILKDQEKGEAELRAKKTLNCEKRKNYRFDIAAVSCSGEQSENATVHISVADINEYAPAFLEPSYVRQVDEGRLYEEVVRVEASDRDCTPKFGDVCKYEILTSDQPFVIDNEGVIRNTEALDYERSHNHILTVVAYDCGMKQSVPVMVTIKVNRVCKLGWKGIPERIDYAPGTGREELFPDADLDLCDVPCNVRTVEARIKLQTSHIGKGCDRDTYSVQSQRKLCGASAESVDLLPNPGLSTEWTKNLPSDDGHESDQIFEFDGNTAAVVPNTVLDEALSHTFTVATWMKHKQSPDSDHHTKEHIICSADDHKMNRHHYALFVRNCRLILLLRRDFSEGDLNIFRPAEWRWKLPQVCDNEWHHYAVSVQFPDVQLFVDGQEFKSEKKNPEIIDDWPLHPTKGINTSLAVGACWQGSEGKMKHYFKGYLAGLAVLLHKNERPEVLACLHKCKESLEVPPMELLEPGMELLTNSELTEITMEGDNKTNLEVLLRKVGYLNSREFPTPGRRNVHISTIITCERGRPVKVPAVESYIQVLQPQQPTIEVNGTGNIAREYEDFRLGVRVFTDVHITVTGDKDNNKEWKKGEPMTVIEKKLDSCTVSVYPPLNPDHETLTLPDNMMAQFGIVAKVSRDGVVVSGADMIYNYEQVLRQIQYTNKKPAYYLNRVFKLICSELNGRFTSNEYVQTLTVIHPRSPIKLDATSEPLPDVSSSPVAKQVDSVIVEPSVIPAHVKLDRHHAEIKPAQTLNDIYLGDTQSVVATGSHAVTIIIVVCVGFLVFMIVLGVIRIRAAHHRSQQEELADTEMAWDDSALTITVNPMELAETHRPKSGGNQAGPQIAQSGHVPNDSSDEDEDDDSSYRDELDSSDDDDVDDEASNKKSKDLEWDNSTLSI